MTTGYVVFAHGSRVEAANQAVRAVSAELARAGGFASVTAAFLEPGDPDLNEAVARVAQQGIDRIVVIPYFLTLGTHLERDLPRIVSDISSRHKGLRIEVTAPLDGHPCLVQILLDRAKGSR